MAFIRPLLQKEKSPGHVQTTSRLMRTMYTQPRVSKEPCYYDVHTTSRLVIPCTHNVTSRENHVHSTSRLTRTTSCEYHIHTTSRLYDDFEKIVLAELLANTEDDFDILEAFRQELRYCLTMLGEKLSDKEVDELFDMLDINKDGRLDLMGASSLNICVWA
ncbi:hypothetical protein DPMN_192416 [Dreissena polymorpha]|uniref:EF-hand domain-containing protein n=1 Tax=Dreissena polymorpha TaxID=45954 RepID=A0A9D4BCL0_DREPO|nr:hypothetical protein DPMN_192416 [Dreissena polymorpha]